MKSFIPKNKELKILCLGAHSDDIEIGCGATLQKLFKDYSISCVEWVVFSNDKTRETEARDSASIYLKNTKNSNCTTLHFRDGYLPFEASDVKGEFEKIKNRIDPDLIFTHYRFDRHQDHRLISDLTYNTFRNHTILEYEIPKWDGDIGNPNLYVEVELKLIERKIYLLNNCFKTQSSKHWFDEETFKALARIRGLESANKYAEAFYVRKMKIF